jgi:hypothetical protein
MLATLAVPRRRHLLFALDSNGGDISVDELAREILAVEGADRQALSDGELESVLVTLHHTHLPKMAVAGLVEWAEDGTRVWLSERARENGLLLSLVQWTQKPETIPSFATSAGD